MPITRCIMWPTTKRKKLKGKTGLLNSRECKVNFRVTYSTDSFLFPHVGKETHTKTSYASSNKTTHAHSRGKKKNKTNQNQLVLLVNMKS